MVQSEPQVYVIFGATGGIGMALARRLGSGGNRLLLVGRDKTKLSPIADETQAESLLADATNVAEVDAAIDSAISRFGKVDGVANCVGSLLLKPINLTSEQEWNSVISTNLGSAFAVTRASVRAMTHTGGSIVLVSSAASRIGLANHEAIAAAKGAINGLVISAAATYAPRAIRVNAIAPGLVRTPLTTRITANEAALKSSTSLHAIGRIGEAEEVASGLAWLLDPAQSWVTGQIIGIDGGLGSVRSR